MVFVERRQERDGLRVEPNQAWFASAKTATAEMNSKPDTFKEKLYGDQRVRTALLELFNHKCAYCEHSIEDCDVEHFRPKGRVADQPAHEGYWWLAYEWTNLYPSCPNCNQLRKERVNFPDFELGPTKGKSDLFPLIDESTRATTPQCSLGKELRALLDPCTDDPEQHLVFTSYGEVCSRGGSPMGTVSIETYGLDRSRLNKARRHAVQQLKKQLQCASNPDEQKNLLNCRCQSDQAFAGLFRSIVRDVGLETLLS
jgi:uncharacterized protein (TIGR02646 family)